MTTMTTAEAAIRPTRPADAEPICFLRVLNMKFLSLDCVEVNNLLSILKDDWHSSELVFDYEVHCGQVFIDVSNFILKALACQEGLRPLASWTVLFCVDYNSHFPCLSV